MSDIKHQPNVRFITKFTGTHKQAKEFADFIDMILASGEDDEDEIEDDIYRCEEDPYFYGYDGDCI